jgi:ubiquinone/menaquinone biosynthesis C-methylase UbiE
MNTGDAVDLIRSAVDAGRGGARGGIWADLGAGDGAFTRALATLVGPDATIYAVDNDPGAIAALEKLSMRGTKIVPVLADITAPLILPGLGDSRLDGLLCANSLHFASDAETVLTRLVSLVRPSGRVVLVEYDQREPSRWVPYPIPVGRLPTLAAAAGLTALAVTATRPSEYSGVLYAASAQRVT